jgi:hypothetical protein
MIRTNDGGPAFPTDVGDYTTGATRSILQPGMTLRDYFIAHAPADVQPWFEPVIPERPKQPELLPHGLQKIVKERADRREFTDDADEYFPDPTSGPDRRSIRDYEAAQDRWYSDAQAWDREWNKQRYIQWPAAWADEILKARLRGNQSE